MFSFLSIEFALGFIAFFCVYWSLQKMPHVQNCLLTVVSYFVLYLMSNEIAVCSLAIFSTIIYGISIMMEKSQYKKRWLISGISLTILNLCIWKYFDFFKEIISTQLSLVHLDDSDLLSSIVLPLGISYYSFQAISYLMSRYKNETAVPALNFENVLCHFSFFATITAGPIARAQNAKGLTDIYNQPCGMQTQLEVNSPRKVLAPTFAFFLITLALFKKWWLAGWLADNWVNPIFTNPMQYHSLEVLAAIYGYTLQLFLDFSGYSEMMIAFGLLLGFRLPVNFKAPLLAHNIREFWDRWHISLSTWIRDYIYIPLGGSRKGFLFTQINLIIAMVLSGIWHGSSLNFMFWGLFHGLAIALLNVSDTVYAKVFKIELKDARNALAKRHLIGKILGTVVTLHFVSFCFVFFRAKTSEDALQVFQALFANTQNVPWTNNPLYLFSLFVLTWALYPFLYQLFLKIQAQANTLSKYRWSIPLFVAFLIVLVCAPSGIPGFIYANF